jgi:hypothetical protein
MPKPDKAAEHPARKQHEIDREVRMSFPGGDWEVRTVKGKKAAFVVGKDAPINPAIVKHRVELAERRLAFMDERIEIFQAIKAQVATGLTAARSVLAQIEE